jgi:hypothetical protein
MRKLTKAQQVALFTIIVDHQLAIENLNRDTRLPGDTDKWANMERYRLWTNSRDEKMAEIFGCTFDDIRATHGEYVKKRLAA